MGALLLVCCGKPAAHVRLLSEAGAATMSDTCFMQRKRLLRLTLAVALLAALAAGSPAGAAATARPVLTTAQFLDDLRFDDSRLAWVQSGPSSVCSEGNAVYRYSFVTGARTRLTNPWCTITSTGYFGRLVLAGKRVYWAQSQGGNLERTWSLWTTADPGRKTRLIQGAVDCGAECSCLPNLGTDLGPTAGAGTTFLFSSHDLTASPTCAPASGDQGIVTASRLTRVSPGPSGLEMADVPGVPGAPVYTLRTLAYAAGRVALVPLENGESPFHAAGRVEIHDVETGALVSQFSPTGSIEAIALSQSAVVVLLRATNGESRIEHRSVSTGALQASWPVRAAIFPALDIHGPRIVYRIGAEIRVLRVDTGRSRLLHRVTSPTFFTIGDVQIEGNRVVWRVRTQGRSTVYQLILP